MIPNLDFSNGADTEAFPRDACRHTVGPQETLSALLRQSATDRPRTLCCPSRPVRLTDGCRTRAAVPGTSYEPNGVGDPHLNHVRHLRRHRRNDPRRLTPEEQKEAMASFPPALGFRSSRRVHRIVVIDGPNMTNLGARNKRVYGAISSLQDLQKRRIGR
jgi:hypothetical protein